MTVKNSYPNEVWHALRTYWESTPKTVKWKETCEFIADSLRHEVPSPQVVARKAAKEKWKKKSLTGRSKQPNSPTNLEKTGGSQLVLGNHLRTTANVGGARHTTTSATSDFLEDEGGSLGQDFLEQFDVDDETDLGLGTHPINIMPVVTTAKSIEKNIKNIIRRHRRRSAALGGMFDSILEKWSEAKEIMTKEGATNEELEMVMRIMSFAAGSTEMLKDLSAAHERLVKIDVGLWGMGPDDMKENQKQARTLQHEELDRKMDEAKQAQQDQEREMLERMARIEAGELSFDEGMPTDDNDSLVSVGDDNDDDA